MVAIRRELNKEWGGRVPVLSIITSATTLEDVSLATKLDVHELVFVLWKRIRARWRSVKTIECNEKMSFVSVIRLLVFGVPAAGTRPAS